MSASLDPEVMQAVHRAAHGFLGRHSQDRSGEVLGLDQSTVSRHHTAVIDGTITHAQRWNAGQLASMVRADPEVMAELMLLRVRASEPQETTETLRDLLAAASRTTDAIAPQSPAGAALSKAERAQLARTYLQLIDRLAQAVAQLRQGDR